MYISRLRIEQCSYLFTHASTYEKRKVLLSSHETREKKTRAAKPQMNRKSLEKIVYDHLSDKFRPLWLKLLSSSEKATHTSGS